MQLVEDQAEGPSSTEDLYDPPGPFMLPGDGAPVEPAGVPEGDVEMEPFVPALPVRLDASLGVGHDRAGERGAGVGGTEGGVGVRSEPAEFVGCRGRRARTSSPFHRRPVRPGGRDDNVYTRGAETIPDGDGLTLRPLVVPPRTIARHVHRAIVRPASLMRRSHPMEPAGRMVRGDEREGTPAMLGFVTLAGQAVRGWPGGRIGILTLPSDLRGRAGYRGRRNRGFGDGSAR